MCASMLSGGGGGGGGGQQAQDDHNYVWDLTAINWWGSYPPFTDNVDRLLRSFYSKQQ